MKAIWNNKIIAESDDTINVENNQYFPIESVNKEYLKDSELTSYCHWKGTANYHDLVVDGQVNKDAVWYYADPSSLADGLKDKVAFWKGVEITK